MSDDVSNKFYKEFQELKTRFESHEAKIDPLIEACNRNSTAIENLVEETSAIISLHKDLQGTIRVGANVQSFGLWLMKWPLIGAGLYTAFNWLISHLPA